MKRLIAISMMLFPSLAWGATYALIIGAGVDLSASGVAVDGGGTYACVNVTGAGSTIGHATLANCADDALNVGESLIYSNSATWCNADADCTITVAAEKELTGSNNAWRVAPTGAGTDSTTGNVVLAAYPFAGAIDYSNLGSRKAGPLLNAASNTFVDPRNRSGNDIGLYQHIDGMIKVARKYLKIYSP
jgi:hypothetical protein